jgi:hypothetical protein
MAALGITIDLAGLTLLSIVVSRVPTLVALIERIGSFFKKTPGEPRRKPIIESKQDGLSEEGINKIAAVYKDCAKSLGDIFQLSELYRSSEESGLPHPHLTIKALREAGLLVPEGNGRFKWRT